MSVDIYESAAEFRAVGAGIGIWMRVWELLDKLGVGEALRSKTTSTITREPGVYLLLRQTRLYHKVDSASSCSAEISQERWARGTRVLPIGLVW